jgi:hypothetical protein
MSAVWRGMGTDREWSNRYEELVKKHRYARRGGHSLIPEEDQYWESDGDVTWVQSGDTVETDKPPSEIEAEIQELLSDILDIEIEESASYESQIRGLLELLEKDANKNRIAEAVGCSSNYAYRFAYDDAKDTVIEKNWSQKSQEGKVSPGTRDRIIRRDGSECLRCGSTQDLEVHHITPTSEGGSDEDGNLATLCKACHKEAHGESWTDASTVYSSHQGFEDWIAREN